jgi:nicotinamide-nucleotide adenylyltransferase
VVKTLRRALFIGRFQPFHNGHLYAIKYILSEFDEVVVVIAAAQYNYTVENPFTAGERVEMIKRGLGELYMRSYIIPVDNIPSNYLWPRHVLERTPRIEVVFSNNKLVQELFEAYGVTTKKTPILPGVSGTSVRRLMAEGGDWRSLVPRSVVDFIEEIRGVERVKTLWGLAVKIPGERL